MNESFDYLEFSFIQSSQVHIIHFQLNLTQNS